jgi:hypothetical protein
VLEKISPDVAAVLKRANEEARSLGHPAIGLEHLLLAFVLDHEGYPAKMLRMRGLTYPTLWVRVERIYGRGLSFDAERPLKAEVGAFFDHVRKAANWPGHQFIPSKVVVDLLLDEPLVVAKILSNKDSTAHTFLADVTIDFSEDASGLGYSFDDEMLLIEGDFTEAANFALLFARIDAATFENGNKIDAHNILLGLIAEQACRAGKRLRKFGLTLRSLRGKQHYADARKVAGKEIRTLVFSQKARKIIGVARKIARLQSCSCVSTEHLFLAILTAGKSTGLDLLSSAVLEVAGPKGLAIWSPRALEHEGPLRDIEFNWWLLRGFGLGPYGSADEQSASRSAEVREPTAGYPGSEQSETFDLSQLDPVAVDLMIMAFREYQKSPFVNFDCKHVFLGILAQGWTAAAHILAVWGVGLNGARQIVSEMETLNPYAIPGKTLPDDVAVLLNQSLKLAHLCGSDKVSAHHLLWAIVKSIDPQIMVLMFRLGLDPALVCENVSRLCLEPSSPRPVYGNSASEWPKALVVLGTLCKPEVAFAMELAFNEARLYQADVVSGDFVFLGLVCSPGLAAKALSELGIQADTVRSAMFELRNSDWRYGSAVRKRLYEMLVRTGGPLKLPAQLMRPSTFLTILRKVEQLALSFQVEPVIVYWGSKQVSRLLPPGRDFGVLVRESKNVSFFSEFRSDEPDQWCFIVESSKLCLVLYGHVSADAEQYICLGSMNPHIVSGALDSFMPDFVNESPTRAKKVETARNMFKAVDSSDNLVRSVLELWPKDSPPAQGAASVASPHAKQLVAFGVDVYDSFQRAVAVSLQAQRPVVGTEHLLRGLLESKNEHVTNLLNQLSIWPDVVLEKLTELEQ